MQNQSDTWLNTAQVAQELGLRPTEVRNLIRYKVLSAQQVSGRYLVARATLERYKSQATSSPQNRLLVTEVGLIEISIALTGAAAAIMAVVPNVVAASLFVRAAIYFVSLIVSFASLYTSLWLLGEYTEDTQRLVVKRWADSEAGVGHIWALLINRKTGGPYWLLALTLMIVSAGLTVAGGVTLIFAPR
jgi:hypothetical protein